MLFVMPFSYTNILWSVSENKKEIKPPKHDVLAALQFILEDSWVFWGTAGCPPSPSSKFLNGKVLAPEQL